MFLLSKFWDKIEVELKIVEEERIFSEIKSTCWVYRFFERFERSAYVYLHFHHLHYLSHASFCGVFGVVMMCHLLLCVVVEWVTVASLITVAMTNVGFTN